MLKVFAMIHIS